MPAATLSFVLAATTIVGTNQLVHSCGAELGPGSDTPDSSGGCGGRASTDGTDEDPHEDGGWDSQRGYLVYRPSMGRFGNQIDHLLGAIATAESLGRVLVVPPLVSYDGGTDLSLTAFESTFSLAALAGSGVRVLGTSAFVAKAMRYGRGGDKLYCIDHCQTDPSDAGSLAMAYWRQTGLGLGGIASARAVPGVAPQQPPLFSAGTHVIEFGEGYDGTAASLFAPLTPAEHPVIVLDDVRRGPFAYPVAPQHRALQRHLVWVAPAKLAFAAGSGDGDGLPAMHDSPGQDPSTAGTIRAVAVHLRGGADWVSACRKMTALSPAAVMSSPQCGTAFTAAAGGDGAGITAAMCSPAVPSMAKNVVAVLERDNLHAVYIGSDCPRCARDLEAAVTTLALPRPIQFLAPPAGSHIVSGPLIDLQHFAAATSFIGNCVSSFSAFAARDRALRGISSDWWTPVVPDDAVGQPLISTGPAMVAAPLIDAGFGLDAAGEAGWDVDSWEDVDATGMLGGGIDIVRPSVVCDLLADGAAATAATVSFGFGDCTAAAACPLSVFASTQGEGGAHGASHPGLAVGAALVFDGYDHDAAEVVTAIGAVDGGIRIVGSMMAQLHFQRLTAVGPQGIVLQDLPLLTALTFPQLERVDGQFLLQAVGLRALSPLPTGALPVLRHVAGDLTVVDNGAIETVALPSLATAGGSILVINNERLATLRLPELIRVGGWFEVYRSHRLVVLDVDALELVHGVFSVSHARDLGAPAQFTDPDRSSRSGSSGRLVVAPMTDGGPQFPYTLDLAGLRDGAGGLCDTPLYRDWPNGTKRCTV